MTENKINKKFDNHRDDANKEQIYRKILRDELMIKKSDNDPLTQKELESIFVNMEEGSFF